jgi:hypothetical protein
MEKNQQFSPDEIERMRAILTAHDAQGRGVVKEFDLNNPPREPYRHQDYPRVMYHHDDRRQVKVHSAQEEKARQSEGFSAEPYPREVEAPRSLDPEDAAEVARLDKQARQPKKPRE